MGHIGRRVPALPDRQVALRVAVLCCYADEGEPALTDFGRGYATCLFLFLGHTRRLQSDLLIYRSLVKGRGERWFSDERAVEMWANGAGDHLAELLTPRRKIGRQSVEIARGIANRVWGAGRSYMGQPDMGPDEARQTIKSAQRLLNEAACKVGVRYPRNVGEAVEIDRSLGLTRADAGGYATCFRKNPDR